MRLNYVRKREYPLDDEILDRVIQDIDPHLPEIFWSRFRSRKVDGLRNLLLNLNLCLLHEDALDEVIISRSKSFYQVDRRYRACHFKYSVYVPLIDALDATGYCILQKGYYDRKKQNRSKQSRIYPAQKLLDIGFVSTEDTYDEIPEPIILRNKERIPIRYCDNSTTKKMREKINKYNQYIEQQEIKLSNKNKAYKFAVLDNLRIIRPIKESKPRLYNSGGLTIQGTERHLYDKGIIKLLPPKLLSHYSVEKIITIENHCENRILRPCCKRIFNIDFKHGGRHYSHWQNMPRKERGYLSINGSNVVEMDFTALHPSLLYNLKKHKAPADCYHIPGIPPGKEYRRLLKKILLILINAHSRIAAIKAVSSEWSKNHHKNPKKYPSLDSILDSVGMSLSDLFLRIEAKHHPIAEDFGSGAGLWLQFIDSEIMSDILQECIEKDIPALPLHDSIIIPEEEERSAIGIMKGAYRSKTGFEIPVTKK